MLFAGRLNLLGILLIWLKGYWFLMGTKYGQPVHGGLMGILATARLDDSVYKVTD